MSLSASTRIALIVDDHESVRQSLAALLENDFDQILEACDGREALDVLAREPDVAVMLF